MNDTTDPPATYSVRMPTEMRRALESFAKNGGRSLHAEILLRLEASIKHGIASPELFSEEEESRIREIIKEELTGKSGQ